MGDSLRRAAERVRTVRRQPQSVEVCMPTGGGPTIVFDGLRKARKQSRYLVVDLHYCEVPLEEVREQILDAMRAFPDIIEVTLVAKEEARAPEPELAEVGAPIGAGGGRAIA
ncbi:hypothetical protein [Corynebacterium spheniscorum]|uniref:tRNA nuclease CdiA C-terminal domain-containing protein n=1 Tax=Corynebacterium spheniscorum TaxID=185761 RepID=A0A1I2Q6K7_9CORY|nr:hypothetical protein [Corynebacterium spheniscorum]KAA8723512.1 hypothetical protein F4V56_03495 [Corynebacterium spheniscorum]SFG21446.1 hypothetical protein SAMN05660282_00308 [Corynebacterium spheniscorum]